MIYPGDETGDALGRMVAQGDDLTRPPNIDFTVVFAEAGSASQFAECFRALGHEVSLEAEEANHDFPWAVIVVQYLAPTHDGIADFENLLQSAADGYGGHNDGWGCFSEPPSTPS